MLMAGGGEELKILLDTSVPLGFGLGDGGLPLHFLDFSYRMLLGAEPPGAPFPHSHPFIRVNSPIY